MGTLSGWLQVNIPDSYEFVRNFFKALNNKSEGHSLRKWLSIGFFWLVGTLVVEYTDNNNVVSVITVLCGMITSLVVTYTVGNYKEKQITAKPPENGSPEQTEAVG
jgi:xanthine/uracil permease